MEPIVDDIELTVKDMGVAVPFYDKLLPLLGFDLDNKSSAVFEAREFVDGPLTDPKFGSNLLRPFPHLHTLQNLLSTIKASSGILVDVHSIPPLSLLFFFTISFSELGRMDNPFY